MALDLILNLDIKQALAALKKLNKSVDDTGKKADDSFGRARDELGRFVATGEKGGKKLSSAFGSLVTPLGAATAGVAALSAAFVALTAVATKAFIEIAREGVELNKQFEISELVFSNLFNDPNLGKETLKFLRQTADELRIGQGEAIKFAQAILPRTSDIDTFRQLLKLTDIQADVTGKSIDELEFSIREALTGDFVSIRDQFDLSKETVNRIKELGKEIGLDKALAQELTAEFERLGKADITGTLVTDLKDINSIFTNLKVTLSEPIFDELKEQAESFIDVLDEQGENISFVADAFGDLAANVTDFIGTNVTEFISSINFEAVEELVDAFNRTFAAARLVIDILFQIPDTEDGIRQLTLSLIKTQAALEEVAKFANRARIALQAAFNFAQIFSSFQKGDIAGVKDALSDLKDLASDESLAKSAENTEAAFERYEKRIKSITEAQKERRVVEADVSKDAINAALAQKRSTEELAKAQAEAADAQEEISKKTADFEEDQAKRLTKFLKKEVDRRIDDELKAAQQRENIALGNTQAIESIFLRNRQAIADVDLTAEEEEIALKGARERRDIERNSANERVGIERNFRQELKRIRDQFNQDAEDAERNNDAQAFLRASRARDRQVDEAKVSRDESLVDVDIRAKEQRDELRIQLKNEVADARSANAEKLANLQNRLDQELERQALKNKQELERQDIKEQQLSERRDAAFIRDIAALEQAELEKQAKLNESLSKQLAAIEAAKTKEIEVTARAEAQKTRIVQAEVARRRQALAAQAAAQRQAGVGALPLAPTRGSLGAGRPFQQGGRPPVGRPITVGEAGPEIFVPDSAGTIIPNNAIFSPPAQPSPLTQMSSSVTNNSPTFNLAETMFQDPIARRNLTNFVLGVLAERV